jgi:3-hydroxyacyl-CoA dehydrogenase/enoyl-CoA hydratase/3-hydroxybutyryl-CoA epimerase
MGGDIAAWCALQGLSVTVQDREEKFLEPAFRRAETLFRKRLKAPGTAREAETRMTRDIEGSGIATADLIIEAIVEDLEIKRSLFRSIEAKSRSDAILASNTSSIRIEDIASACDRPERIIGIHFFNPVASMPLVEVISSEQSDQRFVNESIAFVTRIGKLPLPCASAPGFLVNRILMPYMLEALFAYEDGHAIETIDAAATNFGMPMGPIELADRVGLDVARHVAEILSQSIGSQAPATLGEMVDAGRLGVKSDTGGFYKYADGKPIRAKDFAPPSAELTDRLILILINEAAACFSAGVVDDIDLLDAGVVFGTGFAPFTGGPICYARQCGRDDLMQRLGQLETRFGQRFRAHPGWDRIFRNP